MVLFTYMVFDQLQIFDIIIVKLQKLELRLSVLLTILEIYDQAPLADFKLKSIDNNLVVLHVNLLFPVMHVMAIQILILKMHELLYSVVVLVDRVSVIVFKLSEDGS